MWPLTPEQQRYANIDGTRMKRHVVELAQIALRYRDAGHKWWGRLPGTSADREGMAYMTRGFEALGLTVEHVPYVLPSDWRANDWDASYRAAGGSTTTLATAFPVARTKATGPRGITAEGGVGRCRFGGRFPRSRRRGQGGRHLQRLRPGWPQSLRQ